MPPGREPKPAPTNEQTWNGLRFGFKYEMPQSLGRTAQHLKRVRNLRRHF